MMEDLEKVRARSREYQRALRANPERWRKKLERQRLDRMDPEKKERIKIQTKRSQQRPEYKELQRRCHRERRNNREGWPAAALISARTRAKKRGIIFQLKVEDLTIPPVCPVLGTEFVFGEMNHPCSPSVDRIIPDRGYVTGNIMVISARANWLKNDCTDTTELQRVIDYIKRVIP